MDFLAGPGATYLDALLALAQAPSLDAYAVRHQLARYVTWRWAEEPALRRLPEGLVQQLENAGVPARMDWT